MKNVFYTVIFVLCIAHQIWADNNNNIKIQSITINHSKEFKTSEIKDIMDTKFPSWIPFVKSPQFNESILKNDVKNIQIYCQADGYFDAAVDYSLQKNKNSTAVKIIINIIEGRPSIVSNINLETQQKDEVLRSKILSEISLKIGKRFQYILYNESKKQIQTYLVNHGYGAANVEGKVLVNRKSYQADAVFFIKEGLFSRFGAISVSGNKIVKVKDILNEVVINPDDVFKQESIDQSRAKLLNLHLFQSVNITPVITSSSSIIPVKIQVAEGNQREFKFGFGYGSDVKFRTQAQWNTYFLFGTPRTLTINAAYSAIEESLSGKIFQPYFIDKKSDLTIMGTLIREDMVSYTNEKISSQAQIGRKINDNSNVFIAYNLEVDRPVDLHDILLKDIQASSPGNLYFISSFSSGYNYVFVNDPSYPSHGVVFSLSMEPATFLLGSEADYLKGIIENHTYGLLYKNLILATRFKFGFIKPWRFTKEIPIFKRFFSGGSYSVRGYDFQSIGPRDSAGNPIGGQYLVEGNVELRYPIIGKLKGDLFLDAGDVYQTNFTFDTYELSYGIGTGIRYVTPIGPLGIDIGFPFERLKSIDFNKYNVSFNVGQRF